MSSNDNPRIDSHPPNLEKLEITFPGIVDFTETFRVTRIALGTYLLESSSVFNEVYYGDVVQVSQEPDGKNRFVSVASRSGLKVSIYVLSHESLDSPEMQRFLDRIMIAGGTWERIYGGVLITHLPTDCDLDPLKEMQQAAPPLKRKDSLLTSSDNPQFEPLPIGSALPPVEVLSPDAAPPDLLLTPLPSGPPPAENPIFTGWDVLQIFGLTLVTMFVFQILVLFGARWMAYPGVRLSDLAQKPVLLLISQFLIYAAVALFMMMVVEGKYHQRFWQAIRWNWPQSAWRWFALGGMLLFSLNLLQYFLPMPKETPFDKLFARPRDAYMLSLIAVTLGPLMEELFFRGFLYPVLARRLGMVWGIFLTALPFGLMHMPQYGYAWGPAVVIFLVGVACTGVRAATKSVGASFLVHAGYNGTQMIIAAILTDGFRHMDKTGFLLF